MGAEASALVAERILVKWGSILRREAGLIHTGGRAIRSATRLPRATGQPVGHDMERAVEAVGNIQECPRRIIGIQRNQFCLRFVGDVIEPGGVGCASSATFVAAFL